jgi:hypothetical protein
MRHRHPCAGDDGVLRLPASGHAADHPGDVLLVEDTTGAGHSSRSSEGFVAALVLLEPSRPVP